MINKVVFNHVWLTPQLSILSKGFNFPEIATSNILLTEVDKEKLMIRHYKNKVLEFIHGKKRVYIDEIAHEFKLNIIQVKLIVNQLEEEHKIKQGQ
jgi:hypothetical protein